MINPQLKHYLHQHIIPIYQGFDPAHQSDHTLKVIKASLQIAKKYDVNLDMVYTVACYHDIGIQFGRADHHLTGGLFLFNDKKLDDFFTAQEKDIMKEAVEDHRASRPTEPRSIYGKIIAEADRDIDYLVVLTRTVQYGFKHYLDLTKDEHLKRAVDHVEEKYGPKGYLKLWLKTKKNEKGLKKIHKLLKKPKKMKALLENIYDTIKNEKIS